MSEFDERSSLPRPRKYLGPGNLEVAFRACSLNNGLGVGARDGGADEAIEEPRERKS